MSAMATGSELAPREDRSPGPVGQGQYVVRQGDCLESIAHRHGFFWKTLWDHPDNADLKRVRKDPNVLLEGDRVSIPDLSERRATAATEKRHRFRRKGVPSVLRIVLRNYKGKPRANLDYTLEIDGDSLSGTTDAQGRLEHAIPPMAQSARLVLDHNEEYVLRLGHIDPVTEVTGLRARLGNLGFDCRETEGESGAGTEDAIRRFQARYSLEVTGRADEATQEEVRKQHGS